MGIMDDVNKPLLSLTCLKPVWRCVNRCERLEEQLNDLTELHQNEILNLKQELASMEEKIAYQSYERARDIQVTTSSLLLDVWEIQTQ